MEQPHNYALLLAYDGTAFSGWQKRGRSGLSIEESLQETLERLCQHPIRLQAASRTDAGVHATGQVAQFFSGKEWKPPLLRRGCNALLPPSIVVREVWRMPLSFHPTLDAQGKIYRYRCCTGPVQLPLRRYTSWHIPSALSFEMMEKAARYLSGKHDFQAFTNRKKNETYASTVRTVEVISLTQEEKGFQISLQGDHFLYKMVRNIVGTLVNIGEGKILLEELPQILAEKDRKKAGVTAPAHGLTLEKVLYLADPEKFS